MEATKPVQQAFGSPGGKSYLAPRIVALMPPHKTYVEPFAGGAAVYFRKEPSQREVLSDKDQNIAFAFKFLRDMTPQQFEKLKGYNWTISRRTFEQVKKMVPKNDVERFRKFYYLKRASFAGTSNRLNTGGEGHEISLDRLPRVHERLKRSKVHGGDAVAMVRKYDSPSTFFYLDPPYPNRAGTNTQDLGGSYNEADLQRLVDALKKAKGKFMLSLGTEHAKLLPHNWHIKRVWVERKMVPSQTGVVTPGQYEIIATNYTPPENRGKMAIQMEPARVETRSYAVTKDRGNGHKRVPVGVFTDKKGTRLSRRYHRGWRRVPAA